MCRTSVDPIPAVLRKKVRRPAPADRLAITSFEVTPVSTGPSTIDCDLEEESVRKSRTTRGVFSLRRSIVVK